MGDIGDSGLTPRAQWARRVVREKLFREIEALRLQQGQRNAGQQAEISSFAVDALPSLGPIFEVTPLSPFNLPSDEALPDPDAPRGHVPFDMPNIPESEYPSKHKICIIGAGVTGLYIAMILDDLKIPNLTYEILEGSDRTGGRLYTHYFSKTPHDYYDIGAMRFPQLDIMKRTFNLFDRLKIPLIPYILNKTSIEPPAKGSEKCVTMYNDIIVIDGEKTGPDPFRVSTLDGKGSVPADTVDKVGQLLDDAFLPYKKEMAKDFNKGFKMLEKVDEYSTREYLKNPPPPVQPDDPNPKKLDFFTIQWLETNNTSSGLFDQAFSESVIDSFDFDAPEADSVEKWFCIDGGTSLVTDGMVKTISQKVQHNKRVNRVTWDKETNNLAVHVVGEPRTREPYTTVFNTTSLGCLQRMDLTSLDLHPSQKDAIRTLHYDDSAKVAIKFSFPWWITDCGIVNGGVSSTDIPIRTCVYPSYNLHDGCDKPAILLCSYTWSQDATRIGSLIRSDSPDHESELKALMIDNLARLHAKNYAQNPTYATFTLDQIRARIERAYLEHHAFSWSHDPYTSGAFALFGPGQFKNLYPYLARPAADARFHMAGEASSAHHAWVVGSLDSAVASVHRFLRRFVMWDKIEELRRLYGDVEEVEGGRDGTVHLQVLLGKLPGELQVQV